MVSSVLIGADVRFGQLYPFEGGLRRMWVHEQSLQVCHTSDGMTVVTFIDGQRDAVLFSLDAAQRDHLVRLLGSVPADAPGQRLTKLAQEAG